MASKQTRHDEKKRRSGLGWLGLTIFLPALSLRLIHLAYFQSAPWANLLLGDARVYDAWARRIAGGDWIGQGVFYQAPLYPYFLAVIYKFLGSTPPVVRVVQACIGALSCWMLADAGTRLFSRSAGILAGLLMAFFGPSLFYESLIQKSILDLFFVCCVLWLAARIHQAPRRALWFWMGVALGGLMLTRENGAVIVILMLAWLLVGSKPQNASPTSTQTSRRLVLAMFLCLGLLVPLGPVALRNKIVGGELHFTTSQWGANFYIGNNERADGTYEPLRPGRGDAKLEQSDAKELAEEALHRALTPGEVSRYWLGRSIRYITHEPAHWLRLMGRKIVLALNAAELIDSEDIFTYRDTSPVLYATSALWHFGILMPLAVLAVWAAWPQRAAIRWLHGLWIAYLASLVLFFILGRYRYPLAPMLILVTAGGLVALKQAVRERRRWSIATAFTAALVVGVVANWPIQSQAQMRATTLGNIANVLWQEHQNDASIHYAPQEALRIDPDNGQSAFNLANSLATEGRFDEAVRLYEQVVVKFPGFVDVYNNLGNALAAQGQLPEAIARYRQAIAARPENVETYSNLGAAQCRLGLLQQGKESFRYALRLRPDYPEALRNLASVLAAEGDVNESLSLLNRAIQLQPTFEGAHLKRSFLLTTQGLPDQAIDALESSVKSLPQSSPLLNDLAWLLLSKKNASSADRQRAIALAEKACALTQNERPAFLDTLAAAYAAVNRFQEAVMIERRALKFALASGDPALATLIESHLKLYESGNALPVAPSESAASRPGSNPHADVHN